MHFLLCRSLYSVFPNFQNELDLTILIHDFLANRQQTCEYRASRSDRLNNTITSSVLYYAHKAQCQSYPWTLILSQFRICSAKPSMSASCIGDSIRMWSDQSRSGCNEKRFYGATVECADCGALKHHWRPMYTLWRRVCTKPSFHLVGVHDSRSFVHLLVSSAIIHPMLQTLAVFSTS